jgi:purine nucleosidase
MWIDTDTASDDVVAIVMALKHPNTEVIGMSIVIGNVPVELGVQNALYTNELCGKSAPVHAGAEMPLVRAFATAQHVHGADGMGDIGLPLKGRKATSNNAVHEMIEAFRKEPGELELVALGPLTNLALAIRIEPKFASWVKRCVIMGGTGVLPGNITPLAEFNWRWSVGTSPWPTPLLKMISPQSCAHLGHSASTASTFSASCESSAKSHRS